MRPFNHRIIFNLIIFNLFVVAAAAAAAAAAAVVVVVVVISHVSSHHPSSSLSSPSSPSPFDNLDILLPGLMITPGPERLNHAESRHIFPIFIAR